MFIGHYKAVNKASEFYSEPRNDLQFPTQVIFSGDRYLLLRTVQLASSAVENRFYNSLRESGIQCDVKID